LNLPVFAAKCWAGVLVMMWLRWSLPRLRIDQVMTTCLQYFLPMACALLVGVCLWQQLAPPALTAATRYVLSVGSLVLLALLAVSVLKPPAMSGPAGHLPGAWAGRATPLTAGRK